MTDKLVIVESPAKANTIKKFLGGNTKVVASMGHIRDLPKSKLGIDEKTLEPQYINIRGKGDLIKALKKDAKDAKHMEDIRTDRLKRSDEKVYMNKRWRWLFHITEKLVDRLSFSLSPKWGLAVKIEKSIPKI